MAIADKKIHPEEIATLKRVLEKWSSIDQNSNNLESLKQIQLTFTQLQGSATNAETCFSEFQAFYTNNKHHFTDKIKKIIWETVQFIGSSFAHKNKSELILLAKIKSLLQK
jgi:hypothetical protein